MQNLNNMRTPKYLSEKDYLSLYQTIEQMIREQGFDKEFLSHNGVLHEEAEWILIQCVDSFVADGNIEHDLGLMQYYDLRRCLTDDLLDLY